MAGRELCLGVGVLPKPVDLDDDLVDYVNDLRWEERAVIITSRIIVAEAKRWSVTKNKRYVEANNKLEMLKTQGGTKIW